MSRDRTRAHRGATRQRNAPCPFPFRPFPSSSYCTQRSMCAGDRGCTREHLQALQSQWALVPSSRGARGPWRGAGHAFETRHRPRA
jgi:hypothetical protein